MNEQFLNEFIKLSLLEDLGDGDHTSLACIPENIIKKAKLISKGHGIIAGIVMAEKIFLKLDPNIIFTPLISNGTAIKPNDVIFTVEGKIIEILKAERLIVNIVQRMSGIATQTHNYVQELKGLKTKVLDTRKTAPGMRFLEKEAVRIGGGENHRFGLFDMILIKDNHIDFSGGIEYAINNTEKYLKKINKNLKIEIEARSIEDVKIIIDTGKVDRILLDNFSVEDTKIAVKLINKKYEIESSGGITIKNIRKYAECGVDYISIGALTNQVQSIDLSLIAIK